MAAAARCKLHLIARLGLGGVVEHRGRLSREHRAVDDDTDLRVLHDRARIEIQRPDEQPAPIDAHRLRVQARVRRTETPLRPPVGVFRIRALELEQFDSGAQQRGTVLRIAHVHYRHVIRREGIGQHPNGDAAFFVRGKQPHAFTPRHEVR